MGEAAKAAGVILLLGVAVGGTVYLLTRKPTPPIGNETTTTVAVG